MAKNVRLIGFFSLQLRLFWS